MSNSDASSPKQRSFRHATPLLVCLVSNDCGAAEMVPTLLSPRPTGTCADVYTHPTSKLAYVPLTTRGVELLCTGLNLRLMSGGGKESGWSMEVVVGDAILGRARHDVRGTAGATALLGPKRHHIASCTQIVEHVAWHLCCGSKGKQLLPATIRLSHVGHHAPCQS
jgi:hypothetical protein